MATAPKETSLIVRDLERDLRDEERILHDLERDLRRDADVLKQLEWDVAELGRTVPEAPTRKGNKGATIALAIVSGAVILAAGFGIGMAVQKRFAGGSFHNKIQLDRPENTVDRLRCTHAG